MDKNEKSLPPGITLRKDGRDLKEVQKKLRYTRYEIDHGIYARPDRITVDAWFEVWMAEYQENRLRENTLQLTRSMYKHHIKPQIGKMKLQEVRTEHIQRVFNTMHKKDYAQSFIQRVRNVANQLFKQYRNDLILRNPVVNTTTPPKQQKEDHRVLTVAEQESFLQYARETDLVGFSTGMRIGEILGLQWKDVDLQKNEIHVTGTLIKVDGKEYRKGPTKTIVSNRKIPILPEVSMRIKE